MLMRASFPGLLLAAAICATAQVEPPQGQFPMIRTRVHDHLRGPVKSCKLLLGNPRRSQPSYLPDHLILLAFQERTLCGALRVF